MKNIAMLIDAENIESSAIEIIIKKLSVHGKISIKRIYTDWTQPKNNGWKSILNKYAIKPIQKFAYSKGKGSSDSALIIDAMDLLYEKNIDIFCIVSSDSDYTALSQCFREDGIFVIGAGKKHTPEAFVSSCDDFIYIDEIQKVDVHNTTVRINYALINQAFEHTKKSNDGSVLQSRFSESLRKLDPNFNIKNYGFKKFHEFCTNLEGYKIILHKDKTTFSIKRFN